MTKTLIFNQNGMKYVRLTDDCITVAYADGAEPLHINADDALYEYHLANFERLVENALNPVTEAVQETE